MDIVDAKGHVQDWKLDPSGYFLIRINEESQEIEVGHCKTEPKPYIMIKGTKPEEVIYKIIEMGLVEYKDHCGYIGKEIQKAYIAMKFGFKYVQDSDLVKNDN